MVEGAISLEDCHVERVGRRPAAQTALSYSPRSLEISDRTHAIHVVTLSILGAIICPFISASRCHDGHREAACGCGCAPKPYRYFPQRATLRPVTLPFGRKGIDETAQTGLALVLLRSMSPRSGIFSSSRVDGYLSIMRLAFYMT